ncbi:MAG TPA: GDSL-type esterase/lipase family protein [Casimicrobiaceae bacterium]|jgi:lysophospholipase L1-like esterase
MRNASFPSGVLVLHTLNRALRVFATAAMIGLVASVANSSAASDKDEHGTRVQSWAVGHIAPLPAVSAQYNNQTLREIVHTSIGGDQLRVRIANTFGTAPLVIGAAHVAVSNSGASIVLSTDRALTFGGRTSVSIPAGALALSDPVDLQVEAVSDLAVSVYLPSTTKGETTTLFQGASYVSSAGNFAGSADLPGATPLSEWPFVSGVSVATKKTGAAVVAITDSATLVSQWPRALAERLAARHVDDLGVVSTAIAGNRLLFNSAGPTGPETHWGQSVLTRFERDALTQAGVQTVIVWIGVNDLAGAGAFYPASEQASVDDIIAGLRQLVGRAHEYGLTILGCTISPMGGNTSLPGFDTPAHEAARVALNQWIRTSGVFDGVVDADLVLRDPSQPTRLLPAYDSGDHLHPNTEGGRAVANAIDLKLLR